MCSGCKKQTQYSTKHAKQQGVTIILLKRLFLILLQNIFILFYLKISCLLCAILAYVKYLCSSCKMSPRTTSLCGYIIFRYFTSGSTSSTRASVGGGGRFKYDILQYHLRSISTILLFVFKHWYANLWNK